MFVIVIMRDCSGFYCIITEVCVPGAGIILTITLPWPLTLPIILCMFSFIHSFT